MKKYYKILDMIEAEKLNIIKLYLLDCVRHLNGIDENEIENVVEYCYDLWLNANVDLDLGRLSDIVADNWYDLKTGELTKDFIIDKVLSCY